MLSVDQALTTILNHCHPLETEVCKLLPAIGRVAAEDVYASINVPDWSISALDGFAVRSADISDAASENPCILEVIDTVMAGYIAKRAVTQGTAIRIMTGAPLPDGADCVVGFEDTGAPEDKSLNSRRGRSRVLIFKSLKSGSNIRRAGDQIRQGALAVSRGNVVGPGEAGVLFSLGMTSIRVFRRPVVAIIATGEELLNPGQPLSKPHIYSGHSLSIGAQVQCCGGMPRDLGIARDRRSSIVPKIRRGLSTDMIITTGGVALGDHDLVKDAMAELNEVVFWQVNMMPGKNLAFGLLKRVGADGKTVLVPHLALSGSPTAGMAAFEVLARPAILKMSGRSTYLNQTQPAIAEADFVNRGGFRRYTWSFMTEINGQRRVKPSGMEDNGILVSIADSNCLAIIPEIESRLTTGSIIQVLPLDWH